MIHSDVEKQAEALDVFLQGISSDSLTNLPSEEAQLAQSIRQATSTWTPPESFVHRLEEQLRTQYKPANPLKLRNWISTLMRDLAFVILLIFFIWGLSWSIQHLLPTRPAQPASALQVTSTPNPTPTPTQLVVQMQPTLAPNAVRSPVLSNQLILQAAFPLAPTTINVYRQLGEQPATVETARQIAKQLGVKGQVYRSQQSESSNETLIVSDGVSRVFVINSNRFYYIADYANQTIRQGDPPDPEKARQVALDFLQAHGLLNMPYRVEAAVNRFPGTVRLVWLQDGLPVLYSSFEAPSVYVEVDSNFNVKTIEYNRIELEKIGEVPLISAQEAWQNILSENPVQGIEEYSINGPIYTNNPQSWQRSFPLETPLEIYGYLEMLLPAETGVEPLFTFNNITLMGNLQGLEALVKDGKLLRLNGVFHSDKFGRLLFEVQSASESIENTWYNISGEVKQDGDQIYIVNESQKVSLLNPPANLPIGSRVDAAGVLKDTQSQSLDWYWIYNGYSGSGGGGGGTSMPFRELNLSGNRGDLPTPTPLAVLAPTPQAGTRLEGESGILSMDIRQFSDGRRITETFWWMEPNDKYPDGLNLNLTGNLQGLEAYNQFPIRIWGTLEDNTQQPYRFNVERYELTYPDLKPQTWTGTLQQAALEGKQVILFTDQEGRKYVLKSSIDYDPDSILGAAGDQIIISGFVYPDDNFGGYAVISEVSTRVVNNLNEKVSAQATDNQVTESNNPFEIPVIAGDGVFDEKAIGTIVNIELVYYTDDLYFSHPQVSNQPPYVQPVWRFSGNYQDGSQFEILVQAIPEQYLK